MNNTTTRMAAYIKDQFEDKVFEYYMHNLRTLYENTRKYMLANPKVISVPQYYKIFTEWKAGWVLMDESEIEKEARKQTKLSLSGFITKFNKKFGQIDYPDDTTFTGEMLHTADVWNSILSIDLGDIQFDVKTKIVNNQTQQGYPYQQYPTTVHNLHIGGNLFAKSIGLKSLLEHITP